MKSSFYLIKNIFFLFSINDFKIKYEAIQDAFIFLIKPIALMFFKFF